MDLNNNLINLYSKYYDYSEDYDAIEEFKSVINDCIVAIKEHLSFTFNYEIKEFGPIDFNTIISQNESICFYVKIYDNQIYENTTKIANQKNKKSKNITSDSIKFLTALYFDSFFEKESTVSLTRNCIEINSINFIGFNAKIFVLVSNGIDNIMLDSNVKKLITFADNYLNQCVLDKINQTNYNYLEVVNIIKNLAYKSNLLQNTLIIESLIYNVPNKYFTGTINDQLIKVINYIKFSNIVKFKSIVNENKELGIDNFYASTIYNIIKEFNEFIKILR